MYIPPMEKVPKIEESFHIDHSQYNGRNGNGYQSLTERETKSGNGSVKPVGPPNEIIPSVISWKTLLWFGWCCLCIGSAVGVAITRGFTPL